MCISPLDVHCHINLLRWSTVSLLVPSQTHLVDLYKNTETKEKEGKERIIEEEWSAAPCGPLTPLKTKPWIRKCITLSKLKNLCLVLLCVSPVFVHIHQTISNSFPLCWKSFVATYSGHRVKNQHDRRLLLNLVCVQVNVWNYTNHNQGRLDQHPEWGYLTGTDWRGAGRSATSGQSKHNHTPYQSTQDHHAQFACGLRSEDGAG